MNMQFVENLGFSFLSISSFLVCWCCRARCIPTCGRRELPESAVQGEEYEEAVIWRSLVFDLLLVGRI